MLLDKNTTKRSTVTIIFSYLLLSILTSLLMWVITMGILIRIESIPKTLRDGYQNSYLSFLTFSMLFLFITFLLYYLILFFIPDEKRSATTKIIVGLFVGALPVILGYMATWGFSGSSIADYINIGLLTLGGASIPFVESRLSKIS